MPATTTAATVLRDAAAQSAATHRAAEQAALAAARAAVLADDDDTAHTHLTEAAHHAGLRVLAQAEAQRLTAALVATLPDPDGDLADRLDAYRVQSTDTCEHGRLLWTSCRPCGVAAVTDDQLATAGLLASV